MTKKILYLIILVLLVFTSCYKKEGPVPPRLYITPENEKTNISVVKPVTFYIRGKSDEDLKSFKINTSPQIFSFDTTFGTFTHEFVIVKTISLPEKLDSIPEDSIITVEFYLNDYYNQTFAVRYLRIVNPYPPLYEDTITLYFPGEPSFYDTYEKTTRNHNAQVGSFDLVYAFSSQDGITIASPSSYWLESVFANNALSYTSSNQRNTALNYSNVAYSDMDARFMYDLSVNPHYIESNQAYGSGTEALVQGSIVVFKTQKGTKGAFKVLKATSDSVQLAIKFQLWVQGTD